MGETRTRRITIEVEVPEGVEEDLVARFLEETARRLGVLVRVARIEPRPGLGPEEEELLREIKQGVAARAEERGREE